MISLIFFGEAFFGVTTICFYVTQKEKRRKLFSDQSKTFQLVWGSNVTSTA
jgi:hypothetical protein